MATALRDRAQRIYEKYGNVMLDVAGMTKAGIERKATCRALFSKLLYLAGAPRAPALRLSPLPARAHGLLGRKPALLRHAHRVSAFHDQTRLASVWKLCILQSRA